MVYVTYATDDEADWNDLGSALGSLYVSGYAGKFTSVASGYTNVLPKPSMDSATPLSAYWASDALDGIRFDSFEFPNVVNGGDNNTYRIYHLAEFEFNGGSPHVDPGYVAQAMPGWDAFIFIPAKMEIRIVEGVKEPTLMTTVQENQQVWVAIRPSTQYELSGEFYSGTNNTNTGDHSRKIGGKVSGNDAPNFIGLYYINTEQSVHTAHFAFVRDRFYWTKLNAGPLLRDISFAIPNDPVASKFATGSFEDVGLFTSIVTARNNFQETELAEFKDRTGTITPPLWTLSNPRDPKSVCGVMFDPPSRCSLISNETSPDWRVFLDHEESHFDFNPGHFFPVENGKLCSTTVSCRQYWPTYILSEKEKHDMEKLEKPF